MKKYAQLTARIPPFFYQKVREKGLDGLKEASIGTSSVAYLNLFGNPGTNVYDRDWDVLIILDACRTDLMQKVKNDFEFIPDDLNTITSVGSKSSEWIENTFVEEHQEKIEKTVYVTGNPFSSKCEFSVRPQTTLEVWRSGWDNELRTIPARPLTDTAIRTWRNDDHEKMIVHYMQPHGPFVNYPELGEYGRPEDFGDGFGGLWDKVGSEIPLSDLWEAYEDNLRYVLADLQLLLRNLDAEKVAITSDHGNAIGEWGTYGHPANNLHPSIRTVPWIETTATDTGEYNPRFELDTETESVNIEERLQALGYK